MFIICEWGIYFPYLYVQFVSFRPCMVFVHSHGPVCTHIKMAYVALITFPCFYTIVDYRGDIPHLLSNGPPSPGLIVFTNVPGVLNPAKLNSGASGTFEK